MSEQTLTETTQYDDGRWIRTALVLTSKGITFDLVNESGKRVALINAFIHHDDDGKLSGLSVDVIDKDEVFEEHRALTFQNGVRNSLEASQLVATSFRR